jgi:hypothetical protein
MVISYCHDVVNSLHPGRAFRESDALPVCKADDVAVRFAG